MRGDSRAARLLVPLGLAAVVLVGVLVVQVVIQATGLFAAWRWPAHVEVRNQTDVAVIVRLERMGETVGEWSVPRGEMVMLAADRPDSRHTITVLATGSCATLATTELPNGPMWVFVSDFDSPPDFTLKMVYQDDPASEAPTPARDLCPN